MLAPLPIRFSGMIITWQTGVLALGALVADRRRDRRRCPARRAAQLPPTEALRYEMYDDASTRLDPRPSPRARRLSRGRDARRWLRADAQRVPRRRCRCSASRGASSRWSMLLAYGNGFHDALDGRLPRRLRQRRRGDLAGPDQHAGRRRARRPARPPAGGRRRRRSRRCRWSARRARSSSSGCRSPTATAGACTASAASTRSTARCAPRRPRPGRAASSTTRTSRSGGASPSSAARS